MSPVNFPRMFISEGAGWSEIARIHPSVRNLFAFLVAPLSLVPPLMYVFAQRVYPGQIFPLMRPEQTFGNLMVNAVVFFAIELAMVSFMAMAIRQIMDARGMQVPYENAYALAAIAPIPLWLSAFALFIPNLWVNVAVLALAWVGSIALIRHGVRPLLGIQDTQQAHTVADMVILDGVLAWFSLLIVAAGLLSFFLVWWR